MSLPQLHRAIEVIAKLRDPQDGCPWDLKQNHQSLIKYLIEESYEFIHAIEENNQKNMEEELGDILLQVLLHSQIASESNHFDIESVAKKIADKMIERHPHVFSKVKVNSAEEVSKNWEQIKKQNKPEKQFSINKEDAYLPSLSASYKIGKKSQLINFDWDNINDVLAKVEEELEEVKVEIASNDKKKQFEELGDLLFSVSQLARHLDIDPEEALKHANLKFVKRVNLVEAKVREDGHEMNQLDTESLESYWQKVKKDLKKGPHK